MQPGGPKVSRPGGRRLPFAERSDQLSRPTLEPPTQPVKLDVMLVAQRDRPVVVGAQPQADIVAWVVGFAGGFAAGNRAPLPSDPLQVIRVFVGHYWPPTVNLLRA